MMAGKERREIAEKTLKYFIVGLKIESVGDRTRREMNVIVKREAMVDWREINLKRPATYTKFRQCQPQLRFASAFSDWLDASRSLKVGDVGPSG